MSPYRIFFPNIQYSPYERKAFGSFVRYRDLLGERRITYQTYKNEVYAYTSIIHSCIESVHVGIVWPYNIQWNDSSSLPVSFAFAFAIGFACTFAVRFVGERAEHYTWASLDICPCIPIMLGTFSYSFSYSHFNPIYIEAHSIWSSLPWLCTH